MLKKKPHYAWVILIACCFIEAGTIGVMINCAGVFLRPICNEMGFSLGEMSIYMTIQGFTLVVSLPIAGKLLPKKNFKLLVTTAGIICAGTFATMSQFSKPYHWYIGGIVMGLAGGFLFNVPIMVMVNNWFSKRRGFAMGIAMSFSGIGGGLLSPLATSMIGGFGWRPAYLLLGAISAALVLPWTILAIRFSPEKAGLKPYGWSEEQEKLAEAAKLQNGGGKKLSIKSPQVMIIMIISALAGFTYAYTQHISGYALDVGISVAASGTMVSFVMAGNIVGKMIVGVVADKMGVKRATVLGFLIVIAAFVIMFFGKLPLPIIFLGAAFFGFNAALTATVPPLLTRNACGYDNENYSALVSYASAAVFIMTGIGIMLIGFIFDATGSYAPGFVICTAFCAVAIVMTFLLFSKHGKDNKSTPGAIKKDKF